MIAASSPNTMFEDKIVWVKSVNKSIKPACFASCFT